MNATVKIESMFSIEMRPINFILSSLNFLRSSLLFCCCLEEHKMLGDYYWLSGRGPYKAGD